MACTRLPLVAFAAVAAVALVSGRAYAATGTISATEKWAWSENVGWINMGPTQGGVAVADDALTGYAWSQTRGWINLAPTRGGVENDGSGALSGSAWGEGTGWIDFSGVAIDPATGVFSGMANGSTTGRISFDCASCGVETTWRAAVAGNGGGGAGSGGGGRSGSHREADAGQEAPGSPDVPAPQAGGNPSVPGPAVPAGVSGAAGTPGPSAAGEPTSTPPTGVEPGVPPPGGNEDAAGDASFGAEGPAGLAKAIKDWIAASPAMAFVLLLILLLLVRLGIRAYRRRT